MAGPWQSLHRAGESAQVGYPLLDPGNAGELGDSIVGISPAYIELVTTGAETRTLQDPTVGGQILILTMKTDGGNCTVTTATKNTNAGATTIVFGDVGDTAVLVSIYNGTDGYRWSLVATEGI